jgi:hypothetical protein
VLEELLCRQIARLPPLEDGLGDIRREIAEADESSEIGPADTFPLGRLNPVGGVSCKRVAEAPTILSYQMAGPSLIN